VNDHEFFAAQSGTHDFDATLQDDKEAGIASAGLDENLAALSREALAMRTQACDLRRRQLGKGLLATCVDGIYHGLLL
jgi:hypothetical protein